MTKREMEERIIALEAQLMMLQGIIANQHMTRLYPTVPSQPINPYYPFYPYPTWTSGINAS